RFTLGLREAAYSLRREFDVMLHGSRDIANPPLDLFRCHHDRPRPVIELRRVIAHRLLALARYFCEHLLGDRTGGCGFGFRRLRGSLQVLDGHGRPPIMLYRTLARSGRWCRYQSPGAESGLQVGFANVNAEAHAHMYQPSSAGHALRESGHSRQTVRLPSWRRTATGEYTCLEPHPLSHAQ